MDTVVEWGENRTSSAQRQGHQHVASQFLTGTENGSELEKVASDGA